MQVERSGTAVYRLGERAVVLGVSPPASLRVQRRIWRLARVARTWSGVCSAVPGMNNLTVLLADDGADPAWERRLFDAWNDARDDDAPEGRLVDIPVTYGGDCGPDLEFVAERCGMLPREVAALHAQGEYVVYFLGFQPGFAYLGGLDSRLHIARRDRPRGFVPAGSVGIAGEQTGVYPARAPGGWHLIGRTGAVLFDAAREPAALLSPGDRVRFVANAVS
ncbi:MAG TPA: 5-oxoprolinase subunit PxpB [Candidatus Baltobacteraceae bacterium]|jgi:KipI family sensor histidine kinase inhibitor|nr:5-oxoprolinase subunit PxpB [Candidatus Baltobacteraceae bacterium]